jgi:small subunit ribosomal protein S21
MIIVKVKEGENIDRALRRFKRKFERTGVLREIRERKEYKKPSEERREQLQKAIYIEKIKRNAAR